MNSFRHRVFLNVRQLESREVPSGSRLFAVAEDAGLSRVAVYSAPIGSIGDVANGVTHIDLQFNLLARFTPYPGFSGGIRVALGDVTGDGVDDVITAPGLGGGPHIKVFGGAEFLAGRVQLVEEFFAFDASFRGGVFVSVGQMNPSTPQNEIVVGAGESGGPHVRVFHVDAIFFTQAPPNYTDYYDTRLQSEFFAFQAGFRGGVRVGAADVTGDGRADVIAAAGPGGGPHVRVFDVPVPGPLVLIPYSHKVVDEFFAYDAGYRGGVNISTGELDADLRTAEVVASPASNDRAEVKVYGRGSNGRLSMKASQSVFSIHGVRTGFAAVAFPAATVLAGLQYLFVGYSPAEVAIFTPGTRAVKISKLDMMSLNGSMLQTHFSRSFDVFSDRGDAGIFVGV